MAEDDDNIVLQLVLEIRDEVRKTSVALARLKQKMSDVCNATAAVVREASKKPKPAMLCRTSDLGANQ